MRILALDLAKKTGYAHTDGAFGVKDFAWEKIPYGMRWALFEQWLNDTLDAHESDVVVYEAALHQKGAAARVANALVTIIEQVGFRRRFGIGSYHASTIKKHATGSGRADKPAMAAAAFKRNPDLKADTDDVVDALWLLDLAVSELTASGE